MTEKNDKPQTSKKDSSSKQATTIKENIEKAATKIQGKGTQKNSWEKPPPDIDKTFVLKPPAPKPKDPEKGKK